MWTMCQCDPALSQYVWCKQVGLSPLQVLPTLFKQSLEQLEPPLAQCVHKALQGREEEAPATLLELRQVSTQCL